MKIENIQSTFWRRITIVAVLLIYAIPIIITCFFRLLLTILQEIKHAFELWWYDEDYPGLWKAIKKGWAKQ